MKRLTLGIDFDGTIVTEAFPNIGELKQKTVQLMKDACEKGHLVIVWTARSGDAEREAYKFLVENEVPFHYMNENPEDPYAINGAQGRKIFCDYYLDDRAIHVDDIDKLNGVI
jgi:predicted phosphatase